MFRIMEWMIIIFILFQNFFKHCALPSSHPATHQEEDWTPIAVCHWSHHLCTSWVIICYHSHCFQLLYQCREHSSHLQVFCHPLKSLFPIPAKKQGYLNTLILQKQYTCISNNYNIQLSSFFFFFGELDITELPSNSYYLGWCVCREFMSNSIQM